MNGSRAYPGAGGEWKTEDEVRDARVIAQETGAYCGCACALMMCASYGVLIVPTQSELHDLSGGLGFHERGLAAVLNEICPVPDGTWVGGFYDDDVAGLSYEKIISSLSENSWIAQIQEPQVRAHWVVVDAYVDSKIYIRDPAQPGNSYKMRLNDFLVCWSGIAVHLAIAQ